MTFVNRKDGLKYAGTSIFVAFLVLHPITVEIFRGVALLS